MRNLKENYFSFLCRILPGMQNKGEIIEKAVRKSGYSITKIAKKLGKSARWMYYMFESTNVPIDYVLQIGEVIHYDFSDDIKELKRYREKHSLQEIKEPELVYYQSKHTENDYWKNKYLELLEQHNQLLSELTDSAKLKKGKKK